MSALSIENRERIASIFDTTTDGLINMDWEDIDRFVEKKAKHKLKFQKRDSRFVGRGSVYIDIDRLLSMSYIQKKIQAL
jgi:hypothetical protein